MAGVHPAIQGSDADRPPGGWIPGASYLIKGAGTGILIIFLTLFNAVLGLRQEGKAAAAVAALQKMMIVKARAAPGRSLADLPAEQLAPGDIVSLEAGDVVPADGRLLSSASLKIAESALTGESVPVSKGAGTVENKMRRSGPDMDMVYMKTNVTRGSGAFVVTATGMQTEVGHIDLLSTQEDAKTPLTRQLETLTKQILFLAGFALVASIALNLWRDHEFTSVFTAAVAFAIAAIPTGLPAVVTTILSYGSRCSRSRRDVKRLRSTETLGSTSAINSDKT